MLVSRTVDEAASFYQCVGDLKAAAHAIEVAFESALKSCEGRLLEAQEARKKADVEMADLRQAQQLSEAKIARLETKLVAKREDIADLKGRTEKLEEKLERRREAAKAKAEQQHQHQVQLDQQQQQWAASLAAPSTAAAGSPAEATAGAPQPNGRAASPDATPGEACPTYCQDAPPARQRGSTGAERSVSRSPQEREAGESRGPGERWSALTADPEADVEGGRSTFRRAPRERSAESISDEPAGGGTGGRGRRPRKALTRSSSSSTEPPRGSGGGKRWCRKREREPERSPDVARRRRSQSAGGRGDRRTGRLSSRSSDSRGSLGQGGRGGRSRSRRQDSRQHGGSRGGSLGSKGGKGSSKGKNKDREVPLCIPFIVGKCQWGNKCRERHPEPEDCRQARESLQNKICRFGAQCKRKDCIFKHPEDLRSFP